MKTQISELGSVNRELRSQTGSLVQALRSPNVRGDWGQMQLRRTVEMAGMLGHCDFFEQMSEASESGRLTPDMIVRLPGDRRVVVDAKAPRMYLEGCDRRKRKISTFATRAKVASHDTARGQALLGAIAPTPEFVIMFLPSRRCRGGTQEIQGSGIGRTRNDSGESLTDRAARRNTDGNRNHGPDASRIRDRKRVYSSVRCSGHIVKMRDNLEDTVEASMRRLARSSAASEQREKACRAKCGRR